MRVLFGDLEIGTLIVYRQSGRKMRARVASARYINALGYEAYRVERIGPKPRAESRNLPEVRCGQIEDVEKPG